MSDAERLEAYNVCNERSHESDGQLLTSNPPWMVCKFCGTYFRYEQRLIESNVPGEQS